MQWFKDGDRNTKFFHAHGTGKRIKLQLKKIQDSNGVWLETEEEIAQEAIGFFTNQFSEEKIPTDFGMLQNVPILVTDEQNDRLHEMPEEKKVRKAVFGLNADSAGGPDGFTGNFFQVCWDIVAKHITKIVQAFFCGHELPRYITCTNLVLIPKKKEINSFSDLRPISLSSITSKIFSRILHERMVKLLPELISPQQSGFVKGKSIVENILLVQEIVHDIRIRGKPANVVIKLDMAKAYDRVSWLFLTKVLRQMGFGERLINMVFRIISNNWYSILINGQPQCFFRSTRGVKQGDPLSPTLFILAAECLSRALNALFTKEGFKEYGMPKWSSYVNHLAYADDIIIFTFANEQSMRLIMDTLAGYEEVSGQKVNKGKSAIFMHHSVTQAISELVYNVTQIPGKEFLLTYLGVPFIMSTSVGNSSKHWSTWTTLCHPQDEGGMGFRMLAPQKNTWTYVWKKMLKVREVIEQEIWWKIQQGNSYFWMDNWTGLGALYHIIPVEFEWDPTVILVKDVAEEGQWNEGLIRELLPEDLANHIVENISPPVEHNEVDKAFWKLESRGKFSNPDTEDINHVFLHAPDAQNIWKHFCGPVGTDIQNLHITQVIHKWWDLPVQSEIKYIYKVRRGNFRYAPYKWSKVVELLESYTQPTKIIPVWWKAPERGWVTVNTDGASRGNPGRSSWGFCVRDEMGNLIQAQAQEMVNPLSTNTEAEAMAILQALRYLQNNLAENIIVNMIEEVWRLIGNKTVVVQHIFVNRMADYLANVALDRGAVVSRSWILKEEN
ncbi:uncharacterized protein LOC132601635 [Lycium barbarum]|uniref:uncharacterized protein LOC132601635 n=1 Tax=Lycium barbarum TaxID=112863 RepID=UPI00293F634A|nr:uncharacterized protein LOC132601635 [Lycium barbarum]